MRSKLMLMLVCWPPAGPAVAPVWLPSNEKPCCRLAAAWAASSASTSPVPCGRKGQAEQSNGMHSSWHEVAHRVFRHPHHQAAHVLCWSSHPCRPLRLPS